jgi:uncharacterized protein (DUF1499 family)
MTTSVSQATCGPLHAYLKACHSTSPDACTSTVDAWCRWTMRPACFLPGKGIAKKCGVARSSITALAQLTKAVVSHSATRDSALQCPWLKICPQVDRPTMFSLSMPTRRRRMHWVYYLVAVAVLWAGVRWLNSLARPSHVLGVTNGRLAACPDTPNCVSSQAADPAKRLEPISLSSSKKVAMNEVDSVIRSMPNSKIITIADGYLHAEFCSAVFGFIDDVEFMLDNSTGQVDFRSASRVGHSDLGANRRRMQEIARRLEAR